MITNESFNLSEKLYLFSYEFRAIDKQKFR